MNADSLLNELGRRGVVLSARGDRLVVDAPAGAITPEIQVALVAHKPAILERLAASECDSLYRAAMNETEKLYRRGDAEGAAEIEEAATLALAASNVPALADVLTHAVQLVDGPLIEAATGPRPAEQAALWPMEEAPAGPAWRHRGRPWKPSRSEGTRSPYPTTLDGRRAASRMPVEAFLAGSR
jgi:hypothetical protein